MSRYRKGLPQLSGELFLTDAGIETDLIFNHGIEIREFATHTLLADPRGREAMADYFRAFLALASEHRTGFILDSQTWKAHMHWADDLGASEADLRAANLDSIDFLSELRESVVAMQREVVSGASLLMSLAEIFLCLCKIAAQN